MENEEATKKARSEAARILGSARSAKKAAAVRENGKLGGRPVHPALAEALGLTTEEAKTITTPVLIARVNASPKFEKCLAVMPQPRKSLADHKLQGTRPEYSDAPDFAPGRPKMPKDLTPEAEQEWRRLVKGLMKRRTVTSVDSSALELHVRQWARWRKVAALAEANPLTEVSWLDKNGNEHFKTVEHPASAMATRLENSLRSSLKELSCTPASRDRTRPTAPPVPKGKDVDAAKQAEEALFSRDAEQTVPETEEPEIDLSTIDERTL